jgi:sugar-specific transcriptional regulator TrmB
MEYKIKSFLQQLGLTNNEVKFYITALQNEGAGISVLAQKAKINRAAAYPIVKSLLKKGTIEESTKKGGKVIYAVSPQNLKRLIKRKELELEMLDWHLCQLLPELQALHNTEKSKPRIKIFEGLDGLRKMQDDIIYSTEEGGTIYSIINTDLLAKTFPEYTTEQGFITRRLKKKIHVKAIIAGGKETATTWALSKNKEQLREVKWIETKDFPFTNNMTIYANKVSITTLQEELVGVIIESEEIAKNQRFIFNLAWEGAKKFEVPQSRYESCKITKEKSA